MGLGHYGHAEAILLAGQDKRRATLAKKKREKIFAELTPEEIADSSWQWTLHVCPACGKANFKAPRKCLHRHPEDNELFEVDTVEVTVKAVAP